MSKKKRKSDIFNDFATSFCLHFRGIAKNRNSQNLQQLVLTKTILFLNLKIFQYTLYPLSKEMKRKCLTIDLRAIHN